MDGHSARRENKDARHAAGQGHRSGRSTAAGVSCHINTMDGEQSKERLAVYVDGFNLYHGLHDEAARELLWLDQVALAKSLRPRSSLVRVKYFTATVLNDPGAQSRQDRYVEALKAHYPGRLTVVMGKYMEKPRRCRSCGANWISYEEKQTDVNMAVHIVADVAAGIAETYMIVTADSDVIPAVKMAKAQNSAATIIAQYPPRRQSSAITRLLPSSRQITISKLKQAQFPDRAVAPNGQIFTRPPKWYPAGTTPDPSQEPGPSAEPETSALEVCDHSSAPETAEAAKPHRPSPAQVAKVLNARR